MAPLTFLRETLHVMDSTDRSDLFDEEDEEDEEEDERRYDRVMMMIIVMYVKVGCEFFFGCNFGEERPLLSTAVSRRSWDRTLSPQRRQRGIRCAFDLSAWDSLGRQGCFRGLTMELLMNKAGKTSFPP